MLITSTRDDLQSAWSWIRTFSDGIRSSSVQLSSAAATGPVGADQVVNYFVALVNARAMLNRAAGVPGIVAYAKTQVNDQTIDITVDWATTMAQVDATIAWIIGQFPHDAATGYLLYEKLTTNGKTYRSLTVAQTTDFVVQLNALVATIAPN